jgi:branched-chain amino acid aminotransferase
MHNLNQEKWIWQDGEVVSWADATVHVMTHSLHYGVSIFEGIRSYRRSDGFVDIFRLQDHIDRLFNSAALFHVKVPYSRQELVNACVQVVEQNHLANGYIRPIVYLGPESMGVSAPGASVHVAIATFEWGECMATVPMRSSCRCKTSTFVRGNAGSGFFRAKVSGNYTTAYLAKHEAARQGYDEALLLDGNGLLTEANSENLFIVSKGVLKTPPESSSILPGITREFIMILADKLDIPVQECLIGRDALMLADEVFLTGTYAEISPVTAVDDVTINSGDPGPITTMLSKHFSEVVRLGCQHPVYGHLFTPTQAE